MLGKYKKMYTANIRIRQSISLLLGSFVSIPLGIVSSIVLTKYLGANSFGDFMFIINLFGFAILIFDFGIFQAGNRVLVLNKDHVKSKQIYGALFTYLFILFVIMMIFLALYGKIDINLKEKGLYSIFLFLLPLSWLFLLPRFFEGLLHADNKIKDLVISRLITAVGHVIFYVLAYYLLQNTRLARLNIILYLYILTNLIVFVFLIYRLKPSFINLKERLKEIWKYTKTFGFHVYIGSVIGVGLSQVSGVLISYFSIENVGVGLFSLAMVFASPLKLIPNTIATAYYKDFANIPKIPIRLIVATLALSIIALIFLILLIHPFVSFFYGDDFIPVVNLTYLASLGALFYGMADFFNRFLGANGRGHALRNSAILTGIVVLVMNLILIPKWAEKGAVIAFCIAGGVYLFTMFYFYRVQIKRMR